jgi:HEAT repeat protein
MIVPASHRRLGVRTWAGLFVVIVIGLVGNAGNSQETSRPKSNDEKVDELTRLINSKYTFEDLLNGNPEAVAIDEQVFALTSDPKVKRRIASILLSIGVKDRAYLDYLSRAAEEALSNEMPWPGLYDEHGRLNQKADNPAFVEWCKKHGLDPSDEKLRAYRAANPVFLEWCIEHKLSAQDQRARAYYEIPVPWYDLAAARDPRAYDLLIRGLHSRNLMIAATAAKGLARLQDPKAIDELIATGRRVPGEARGGIAQALLYFPDPKAQAAADELSDVWEDRKIWDMLRQEARSKGVKALFDY